MINYSLTNQPEFLCPQEVAGLLRVHERTVRIWLNNRDCPCPGIRIGKQWRIPTKQLMEWLHQQTNAPRLAKNESAPVPQIAANSRK